MNTATHIDFFHDRFSHTVAPHRHYPNPADVRRNAVEHLQSTLFVETYTPTYLPINRSREPVKWIYGQMNVWLIPAPDHCITAKACTGRGGPARGEEDRHRATTGTRRRPVQGEDQPKARTGTCPRRTFLTSPRVLDANVCSLLTPHFFGQEGRHMVGLRTFATEKYRLQIPISP